MTESDLTMSGGQGGSGTEPKEPLQQPQDALELKRMDQAAQPTTPDVNDGASSQPTNPTAAEDPASSTSIKGKEKATAPPAVTAPPPVAKPPSHQDRIDPATPAAVAGPSTRQARTDSLTIGAADAPHHATPSGDGPVCNITLLLPTGARHPYRIDERYLTKRSVEVPEIELTEDGRKDPFSISVYKLKELILREWREEWEGKPASPSSIRLIHFGKMLEDKEQLKKYHFSADTPNVVHMSVKPAEMLEEDEAGRSKIGSSGGRNNEGSSGCCVIL